MKMWKPASRGLSLLLALAFVFSLVPAAMAAPGDMPVQQARRYSIPATADYVPGEVLVCYADNTEGFFGPMSLEALNAPEEIVVLPVEEGSEQETINELLQDDGVLFAEPNYIYHPFGFPEDTYDDPGAVSQLYLKYIGADAAYDAGVRGQGVTVAVIDTGLNPLHEDFSAAVDAGKIKGFSAVTGKRAITPMTKEDARWQVHNHGGHVAGILRAQANNTLGVASVAPECTLLSIQTATVSGGQPDMSAADLAYAIDLAINNGANIINMSLGGTTKSETLMRAIEKAYLNKITVFSAMGNAGNTTTYYPAAFPTVIGVAALEEITEGNLSGPLGRASFSNMGNHADLAMPGSMIYSTVNNLGYTYMNGTSMATPVAAGIAALAMSRHGTTLSPDTVKNLLYTNASQSSAPDNTLGYGSINAAGLSALLAATPTNIDPLGDNDTTDTATVAALDTPISTSIGHRGDVDQFTFTPATTGTYYFEISSQLNLKFAPPTPTKVWDINYYTWISLSTQTPVAKNSNFSQGYALTAGTTYYFAASAQTGNLTGTYTLQVTQTPLSTGRLSALTVDQGTLYPAFDAEIFDYYVFLPAGTSSTLVTATGDGGVNVSIGPFGGTLTPGDTYTASPSKGATLDLTVRAGFKDINLHIRRAPDGASSDTGLRLSAVPRNLVLWQSPSTDYFGLYVPADYAGPASVVPHIAAGAYALISGTNNPLQILADGTTSHALNLPASGVQYASITVLAPDFSAQRTYTLDLSRTSSTNNALCAIDMRPTTSGAVFSSPFDGNYIDQYLSLDNNTDSLTLQVNRSDNQNMIFFSLDGDVFVTGTAATPDTGYAGALTYSLTGLPVGETTLYVRQVSPSYANVVDYEIHIARRAGYDFEPRITIADPLTPGSVSFSVTVSDVNSFHTGNITTKVYLSAKHSLSGTDTPVPLTFDLTGSGAGWSQENINGELWAVYTGPLTAYASAPLRVTCTVPPSGQLTVFAEHTAILDDHAGNFTSQTVTVENVPDFEPRITIADPLTPGSVSFSVTVSDVNIFHAGNITTKVYLSAKHSLSGTDTPVPLTFDLTGSGAGWSQENINGELWAVYTGPLTAYASTPLQVTCTVPPNGQLTVFAEHTAILDDLAGNCTSQTVTVEAGSTGDPGGNPGGDPNPGGNPGGNTGGTPVNTHKDFPAESSWFDATGDTKTYTSGAVSLTVDDRMMEGVDGYNPAGGSVTFRLDQDGTVTVLQGGQPLDVYNVRHPMLLSLSAGDTGIPLVTDKTTGQVIPRSFAKDGAVSAKIYGPGVFEITYVTPQSFTDTRGKWMEEAARVMGAHGVIKGVGNNNFAPDKSVTRAEFVTMLMRYLGPKTAGSSSFADKASIPSWSLAAADQAFALAIAKGDNTGRFNPNATITRQDMFLMTARAMDTFGLMPEMFTMEFVHFSDWDSTADYAKDALQKLAKLKLVSGSNGRLNPTAASTRGEAAQFLYNLLQYDAAH